MLSLPPARAFAAELSRSKAVFLVWPVWTPGKGLPDGKRQRDVLHGPGAFWKAIGPPSIVNVVTAAVRSSAAVLRGIIGNTEVEMMLDSGSTVSLIQECIATRLPAVKQLQASNGLQLASAAGETIPVVGRVVLPVQVGGVCAEHPMIVVRSLITQVILGMDFLQKHGLVLDFTTMPVNITAHARGSGDDSQRQELQSIVQSARKVKAKVCAVEAKIQPTEQVIDDCAIPQFSATPSSYFELPQCSTTSFFPILEKYKDLFRTSPGHTNLVEHFIPMSGTPVKVPPSRIPANYRAEVVHQIQTMLEEGIIEESSSPWMAPAVFVRKKTGEIRLCVDYQELNKKTAKDADPLPRPDEVQD